MTKRIVSGVFLLVALGALGLILAGALTSGEQLIVRFLTAVIVAALGLYVISDLRLQADDTAVAGSTTRTAPVASSRVASAAPPPNSTAAFMATVTGKKASSTAALDDTSWNPEPEDRPLGDDDGADRVVTTAAFGGDATETDDEERDESETGTEAELDEASEPASVFGEDPYGEEAIEAGQWPVTPDGRILEDDEGLGDTAEIDGLVAIFTKTGGQDAEQRGATVTELPTPVAVGGEAMPSLTSYPGSLTRTFGRRNGAATVGPSGPPPGNTLSLAPSSLPAAGGDGPPPPPPPIGPPNSLGGSPLGGAPANADTDGPGDPANPDPTTPNATAPEPTPDGTTTPGATTDGTTTPGTTTDGTTTPEPTADGTEAPGATTDGTTVPGTTTPGAPNDGALSPSVTGDSPGAQAPPGTGGTHGTGYEPGQGVPAESGTAEPAASGGDPGAGPTPAIEAASYARARVIDLRAANGSPNEIDDAIRAGELDVITSLIDKGVLSTEGPLSDRDVRTMVYVAFTSSELRKILLAGGTVDSDVSGLDLGPVEVFSDAAARPELAAIEPIAADDTPEAPGDGVAVVDAPNDPASGTAIQTIDSCTEPEADAADSTDEADADDAEIELATSD